MDLRTFAATAATIAMEAFRDYTAANNIDTDDIDRACELLRSNMRTGLGTALADAKEALDANMPQAAEATFAASMRLIGISAAKQFAA